SNRQPTDYKSVALPLSYIGPGQERLGRSMCLILLRFPPIVATASCSRRQTPREYREPAFLPLLENVCQGRPPGADRARMPDPWTSPRGRRPRPGREASAKLEERQRDRDRDIQRLERAVHRDPEEKMADALRQAPQALALGAGHQNDRRAGESGRIVQVGLAVAVEAEDPVAGVGELTERAGEVRDARDVDPLDCTRRRLHERGGERRRPIPCEQHRLHSGGRSAPEDRADVPGVRQAVERENERLPGTDDVGQSDAGRGLAHRGDALVRDPAREHIEVPAVHPLGYETDRSRRAPDVLVDVARDEEAPHRARPRREKCQRRVPAGRDVAERDALAGRWFYTPGGVG